MAENEEPVVFSKRLARVIKDIAHRFETGQPFQRQVPGKPPEGADYLPDVYTGVVTKKITARRGDVPGRGEFQPDTATETPPKSNQYKIDATFIRKPLKVFNEQLEAFYPGQRIQVKREKLGKYFVDTTPTNLKGKPIGRVAPRTWGIFRVMPLDGEGHGGIGRKVEAYNVTEYILGSQDEVLLAYNSDTGKYIAVTGTCCDSESESISEPSLPPPGSQSSFTCGSGACAMTAVLHPEDGPYYGYMCRWEIAAECLNIGSCTCDIEIDTETPFVCNTSGGGFIYPGVSIGGGCYEYLAALT